MKQSKTYFLFHFKRVLSTPADANPAVPSSSPSLLLRVSIGLSLQKEEFINWNTNCLVYFFSLLCRALQRYFDSRERGKLIFLQLHPCLPALFPTLGHKIKVLSTSISGHCEALTWYVLSRVDICRSKAHQQTFQYQRLSLDVLIVLHIVGKMRSTDRRNQELKYQAKIVVSADLILSRPIYLTFSLCSFPSMGLSDEILEAYQTLTALWAKNCSQLHCREAEGVQCKWWSSAGWGWQLDSIHLFVSFTLGRSLFLPFLLPVHLGRERVNHMKLEHVCSSHVLKIRPNSFSSYEGFMPVSGCVYFCKLKKKKLRERRLKNPDVSESQDKSGWIYHEKLNIKVCFKKKYCVLFDKNIC